MKLALCMIVKDEVDRIVDCLDPVHRLVDQIVVIDTGSSDGTPGLLRRRYGIEPLDGVLEEARCYCKCDQRNRAIGMAETDWILILDADERIAPEALQHFRSMHHAPDVAGYFGRWTNHLDGAPPFEDYKLFLFRKGLRKRGLVHDNAQVDIRERGQRALWLQGLEVTHLPDPIKLPDKTSLYRWRLERAIALEPDWLRYRWFLGYMDYQAGHWDEAAGHLAAAADNTVRFPVESLNSRMLLAEIQARQGWAAEARATLVAALEFHRAVAHDFEVAVNFRLAPWLQQALATVDAGQPESIRAYRFAR